jgi:hypothetical protein
MFKPGAPQMTPGHDIKGIDNFRKVERNKQLEGFARDVQDAIDDSIAQLERRWQRSHYG